MRFERRVRGAERRLGVELGVVWVVVVGGVGVGVKIIGESAARLSRVLPRDAPGNYGFDPLAAILPSQASRLQDR
jgi:hypothetical protein